MNMEKARARIRDGVLKHMPAPGNYDTPIEGVKVARRDSTTTPETCFYVPRFIKIVQG